MALVLTAAQMRALDRAAMDTLGVPGLVLMENAGRGVAELVRRERPSIAGTEVRIVCGGGQNGGDGFVAARHLANWGARVRVLLVADRAKVAGDAATFLRVLATASQVPIDDLAQAVDPAIWREHLAGAEVVVDALFGTGLRADVTGVPAAAIGAMNEVRALRVAVDVPSGLDADTGLVRGAVVRADLTATMGAYKPGLVLDPGVPVGRIAVVDLGVSPRELLTAAREKGPLCQLSEGETIRALLPRRPPGAHKGTSGHLLIVAGSAGKTGAALLAARGAFRAGAGLVTVASTAAGQAALDAKVAETMTESYTEGLDADDLSHDRIARMAARMRAVAIGPGIPTGPVMAEVVRRLVTSLPLPLVVDADGLNLLGRDAARLAADAPAPRIFTPHPGEMARLVGGSTADVQADRLNAARRLAEASGAIVVLKGARTLVAEPDGTAHVNPAADPRLATAGSGDVLLGVIAALCAQGLAPADAARVGVYVHGRSAELASATLGSRLLVASDLPDGIARVVEDELRAGERELDPVRR
jgi:NAD(P)H-hydrate epimerase